MNPRIKPTQTPATKGPTPAELLAKMPRRPMSPEQQAAALEKVQQQATQRVKLGQQLFEAADAKLKQHQQVLREIQDQQQVLREQVQEDVAKSLQSYDQWMGKIDESFTDAIQQLNKRLDDMELRVDSTRGEMEAMIEKAAKLLNQTQGLLAEAFDDVEFDQASVAAEMQDSVPADPQLDIDSLPTPVEYVDDEQLDDQDAYDAGTEILEVEIIQPYDASRQLPDGSPGPELPDSDEDRPSEDDVFGQVLRRLRTENEDGDGNAAA